jgi:hypothetical protein
MGAYALDQGIGSMGSFATIKSDATGAFVFPSLSFSVALKLKSYSVRDMRQALALVGGDFSDPSIYQAPQWKLNLAAGDSFGAATPIPPTQPGGAGGRQFYLNLQPYFVSWTVPYIKEVWSFGAADAVVASLTYVNSALLAWALLAPVLLAHWHRKSKDALAAALNSSPEGSSASAVMATACTSASELALTNRVMDIEANMARVEALFESRTAEWLHQAETRRLLGMAPKPPPPKPVEPETPFATPAGRGTPGAVEMTGRTGSWKCALPSCSVANGKFYVGCPKCGTAKYCSEEHRQTHWLKGHNAECRLAGAAQGARPASGYQPSRSGARR